MTVRNPALSHVYLGDGMPQLFDYTNPINSAEYLNVYLFTDGVREKLELDVDYTVSGVGNDDGGSVQLTGVL